MWSVPGTSDDLMDIVATMEHGSDLQIGACMPAAVELEEQCKLHGEVDEDMVRQVLLAHPVYACNYMDATSLPNFVPKLVKTCFAVHRAGNRAVDPLGHVLNKAWPMRCSVRNFCDIVSGYILSEPEIYQFVLLVLHACMLGVYPTSSNPASLRVKMILYRCYERDRLTPTQLAEWVQQKNHMLLFIAIKEYIAYAISLVPGLSHVLYEAYNWKVFVESVTRQADSIREALNSYNGPPSAMFQVARDAVSAVRSYKCPVPPVDYSVVCDNLQAVARTAYHPDVDVYHNPLRMPIYKIIRPLIEAGAPLEKVAVAVGIRPDIAELIERAVRNGSSSAEWKVARTIKCRSTQESLLLHEFIQAWIMCHRISTYRLPPHVLEEQRKCEHIRGRVVYACACCRQLREFVVDDNTNNNAWACGHHKVLLDDRTGDVYCGKRVEKNSVPMRKPATDNCRSYWKAQQSTMCGYSPLMHIDMDGYVLSFYGKLYVLCPCCGCVMRLHPGRYYNKSYRCMHCSYRTNSDHPDRCFHCYITSSELQAVALQETAVHVCSACLRRWMSDDSLTTNIGEDVAHQAINERWSTNRVAVYCAGI